MPISSVPWQMTSQGPVGAWVSTDASLTPMSPGALANIKASSALGQEKMPRAMTGQGSPQLAGSLFELVKTLMSHLLVVFHVSKSPLHFVPQFIKLKCEEYVYYILPQPIKPDLTL